MLFLYKYLYCQYYFHNTSNPVLSFHPPFSLPDMLCDPIDPILWKGTLFVAMTCRTVFIDGLLAELSRGFPQL